METRKKDEDFFENLEQLMLEVDSSYKGTDHDELKKILRELSSSDFVSFLERRFSFNSKKDDCEIQYGGLYEIFRLASCGFMDGLQKLFLLSDETFNQLDFSVDHCFEKMVTLENSWIDLCICKLAQFSEKKLAALCQMNTEHQKSKCGAVLLVHVIERYAKSNTDWSPSKATQYGIVLNRLISMPEILRGAIFESDYLSGPLLHLLHLINEGAIQYQPLIHAFYAISTYDITQMVPFISCFLKRKNWFLAYLQCLLKLKAMEAASDNDKLIIKCKEFINAIAFPQLDPSNVKSYMQSFMYFALSEWVNNARKTSCLESLSLRFSLLKKVAPDVAMGYPWFTQTCFELTSHYFNRKNIYGLFGRCKDLKKAISYAIKTCLSDFSEQNKMLLMEIINSYLRTNQEQIYFVRLSSLNVEIEAWVEKKLSNIIKQAKETSWDKININAEISSILADLSEHRINIQLQEIKPTQRLSQDHLEGL